MDLKTCAGSVLRTPASRLRDPALLLANGHCVEGKRPRPGAAVIDRPAPRRRRTGERRVTGRTREQTVTG
ncbi:hypothetical protein GCM10009863_18240 [Streptomyces axinellae]|uniref:Uncharacterized protein n=1 Tax=Streptomyces axinellae TaxID=552788 RepID=A0ABN3PYL5_9ACTN